MFRLWSSIAVNFGYQQKYKNNYHNLPQNTTLLISFTTLFPFILKMLQNRLVNFFNKSLRKIERQREKSTKT